jgi:hypothetical protein
MSEEVVEVKEVLSNPLQLEVLELMTKDSNIFFRKLSITAIL